MTTIAQKKLPLTRAEEGELLRRGAAGDRPAVERLLRQYRPLVLRAAHQSHLASVREDAESEATLSLLTAIRTYDPALGVPFAAYAKQKVFGDIRTYFRKERLKWQSEFVPYTAEDGSSVWDELADPARRLEEVELADAVERALSALPKREREVLECLLSDRTSQFDLAKEYGVVFQTITKWKQKAAGRLGALHALLKNGS